MEEELVRLQDLDDRELLARMEGGLFGLLDDREEYAELFRVAAAIGIKHFVAERLRSLPREEILALFEDGERVLDEYISFAAGLGLFEDPEAGPEQG